MFLLSFLFLAGDGRQVFLLSRGVGDVFIRCVCVLCVCEGVCVCVYTLWMKLCVCVYTVDEAV